MSKFTFNRLDLIVVTLLAAVSYWFYYRSSVSLNYHWQWLEAVHLIFTPSANNSMPYFFQGVLSTIRLSLWGMVFAATLGLLVGIARLSSVSFIRRLATAYVQLIRNIPPLVFVFIFYFFISNQLIPVMGLENLLRYHHGDINPLQSFLFGPAQLWENLISGVLCVGLISAAYIAEIVRSGFEAVPKGQWEASQSLGLSRWSRFRFIIAPQVLTAIVPALAGQFISLVKDSSIISLISIQELTFVGTEIANSSGMIFEIWLLVGLGYLILCLLLSLCFSYIEHRSSRHLH
jgi:polar amino acid transport system permease protein